MFHHMNRGLVVSVVKEQMKNNHNKNVVFIIIIHVLVVRAFSPRKPAEQKEIAMGDTQSNMGVCVTNLQRITS